jgi:hypothetical protein
MDVLLLLSALCIVEMIQKFGLNFGGKTTGTEDGWAMMERGEQKPRKKRRAMDLLKHCMVIVFVLKIIINDLCMQSAPLNRS